MTEASALDLTKPSGSIRAAVFNTAMARRGAGKLIHDIERGEDDQVRNVAEIILRVRPDILVINELDHDPAARALGGFRRVLADGMPDLPGIDYPYWHHDEVNTGVPSGHDLDGDGQQAGPRDAFGFGRFPGQYAMAVLSRFPITRAQSYRLFRWAALPGAARPMNPDGTPYHPDAAWQDLRLSSKNHWNLTVALPTGQAFNLLVAHPTPPVFDGPEDLNGRRNADEIRLLTAMIDAPDWLIDDEGNPAQAPAAFLVAGDLNADPHDGEGHKDTIGALLTHPRVTDPRPESPGAAEAARDGGANAGQRGKAAQDTADWPDEDGPGNMRVDYLLPSTGLRILKSGVFWPPRADPLARLVKTGRPHASSDHRLVWLDFSTGR
ncbi:endonuclease/exonuclease/phosphatase family protein [Rhodobacteraceae bacterium NNCM2]|nr:endonuclease/exonuclease/phosphatase family protein [Coraliihabitans acroporae]